MLLVVYDIADDRRRRRLHDKLCGLGHPVQYSAFECHDERLDDVLDLLEQHVRRHDRLRVYRVCASCYEQLISIGAPLELDELDEDLVCPGAGMPEDADAAAPTETPGAPETDDAEKFLLRRVCDRANLREAWKRVRSNRGCAGIDGVSLAKFERTLDARLARLGEQLLAGTYQASKLRTFSVPKASGGVRKLSVPTVRDRVAQEAVLLVIGPLLDAEFETSSFAYRPGRSVRQAIRRIAELRESGWTHVLDGDITDYFGTVDREDLMERFSACVDEPEIVELVRQWVFAADAARYRQESQLRGIPQGGVISPLLANLYLDAFDERIESLGYKLVRYADDFVVLCRSQEHAERALVDVGVILGELKLELNREKTEVTSFARGFRFLGHLLIGEFTVKQRRARLLQSGRLRSLRGGSGDDGR